METHTIQAAPCPICGDSDFAWEAPPEPARPTDFWTEDDAGANLAPRECATCGNVQVLATR